MPAPLIGAIVAGVARAGGAAFASAGARTAASAAAKGAGQAAATGAAEASASTAAKAPGFVLQNAPGNAKDITAALRGIAPQGAAQSATTASQASSAAPAMAPPQMPAAPTPATPGTPGPSVAPKMPGDLSQLSKPAPSAPSDTAKSAAEAAKRAGAESAAKPPEPAPSPRLTPDATKGIAPSITPASGTAGQQAAKAAGGGSQPPAPPHGPTSPPVPPEPPGKPTGQQAPKTPTAPAPTAAQQAAQPAKPSFLERAGKMAEKAHEAYTSAKEKIDAVRNLDFLRSKKSKSVDEDTRGMSLEERYKRLQQNGTLLDRNQVAKASGVAMPSQQDVIGASEKAEQRERETADANRARSEGSGANAAKAAGGSLLAAASLPVVLPFVLMKTAKHVEAWGTGVLESSRHLRRFDGALSQTFAQLDRQKLLLQMRTAQATGGSAAGLGKQLGELRKELQPFNEAAGSALNIIALNVVWVSRGIAAIVKWHPIIMALGAWISAMEEEQRKKNPNTPNAFDVHYQAILRGDFSGPKNERPK